VVVQPDVLVVCDPNKLDRRGVRGAPDWVVEVLSPSSASRDQIEKRRIYERHGVLEYWLVHPTDRILTVYRLQNGEYGKPDIFKLEGSTPVAVLPGVSLDWEAMTPFLINDE
jgi:Uma2 family endonuclease